MIKKKNWLKDLKGAHVEEVLYFSVNDECTKNSGEKQSFLGLYACAPFLWLDPNFYEEKCVWFLIY